MILSVNPGRLPISFLVMDNFCSCVRAVNFAVNLLTRESVAGMAS